MTRQIIAAGHMVFGVLSTVFWFIIIPHLSSWQPSRYVLGGIVAAVGLINIAGLIYLIGGYRVHPRWVVAAGICGNALSIFIIAYAVVGCLYLEYFFRM
jgi:hypothetical protein